MNNPQMRRQCLLNQFWSSVFIRRFKARYFSSTFQAQFPMVADKVEKRCANPMQALEYAAHSEDSAFYFFESVFSTLTPHEQKAASGMYRSEWLQRENEIRNAAELTNQS